MATPIDTELYDSIKKKADLKFKSKSGIYRSSWIVSEYKRQGGKYSGSKPKSSGLKRWYDEKWVDLNRPIKSLNGEIIGYNECGRKSIQSNDSYPLCRPSKRISKDTPKTYKEISKESIEKAKKDKSVVRNSGNIRFEGGKSYPRYYSKKSSTVIKVLDKVKK